MTIFLLCPQKKKKGEIKKKKKERKGRSRFCIKSFRGDEDLWMSVVVPSHLAFMVDVVSNPFMSPHNYDQLGILVILISGIKSR